MKRLIVTCLCMALLIGVACTPRGKQGEKLPVKQSSENYYEITVVDSGYQETGNEKYLYVLYRVNNTGKVPMNIDWQNKVVTDNDGRKFSPQQGDEEMDIQPLRMSSDLHVEYSLPAAVDETGLWWGLMAKGEYIYRIKLTPRKL